ncbi:Oligopeptide-binding protein AppA [Candidatus Thermoflexus japonica]|uniref:Oligopeptide-binding protein AppA n=1 Tax=Candidatus Thermoflexus japonica TaxID=2035417 RepID=A0A2H5Y5U6_9CHLR|nr:Oligopeptide-binding protein AppA [Candidatus Thermoflexus japonica]
MASRPRYPTLARGLYFPLALVLFMALSLGVLMASLALRAGVETVPARGGHYVEAIVGPITTLNPLQIQPGDPEADIARLIFNSLVRLDAKGLPEGDLAQRWEVSEDGLRYTFHLRPNVRWHDGVPLTAEDVLFTVRLLQSPDLPGPSERARIWQSIEVVPVNSLTVQFRLPEPLALFPDLLTFGILPAHALRDVPPARIPTHPFNLNPIGTGPYRVASVHIEEGRIQRVVLSANPSYFRGPPLLEQVEFRIFPDTRTALLAYRAGEVQGIARIAPSDLDQIRALPSLNLFSALLSSYQAILLNHASPLFREREVREALWLALDRQRLIDQFLAGQGVVASSPIPPGHWAFHPRLPPVPYDPEKARALLEARGWVIPEGGTVRQKGDLTLRFRLAASADGFHDLIAQEIARQWRAIGIAVDVDPIPGDLVEQILAPHRFDAALVELMIPGDPDPYPFWHETQVDAGQNYGGFRDRDISEVIEEARRTPDIVRRRELYWRFQELFQEKVPAILLFYPVYTFAVDERISGIQVGALLNSPADRFEGINEWYALVRRRIIVR